MYAMWATLIMIPLVIQKGVKKKEKYFCHLKGQCHENFVLTQTVEV